MNSDPFAVVPVKAPILDGMNIPIKADVGDVFILKNVLHLGSGNIVIHGVSDKPSFSDSHYWGSLSGTLSQSEYDLLKERLSIKHNK